MEFTACKGELMQDGALTYLPYVTHIATLQVRHS